MSACAALAKVVASSAARMPRLMDWFVRFIWFCLLDGSRRTPSRAVLFKVVFIILLKAGSHPGAEHLRWEKQRRLRRKWQPYLNPVPADLKKLRGDERTVG